MREQFLLSTLLLQTKLLFDIENFNDPFGMRFRCPPYSDLSLVLLFILNMLGYFVQYLRCLFYVILASIRLHIMVLTLDVNSHSYSHISHLQNANTHIWRDRVFVTHRTKTIKANLLPIRHFNHNLNLSIHPLSLGHTHYCLRPAILVLHLSKSIHAQHLNPTDPCALITQYATHVLY